MLLSALIKAVAETEKAARMDLFDMKCILPTLMLLKLTFEGTFQSGCGRTTVASAGRPAASARKKCYSSDDVCTFQPIALLGEQGCAHKLCV